MKQKITIPLQIKALDDREFIGHGSMFGNIDLGGDVVLPGAFKRSLAKHRKAKSLPQMFWMHDPSRVPGKWTSMGEDEDGLIVKGVLADTPLGNEIHTLLKMDAVRGLSIGYSTVDQDFDADGNRLLKELELWEVSVVSLPMNPLAQVTHAKSQLSAAGEYVPTVKEFERILREAGCSRTVAKNLVHNMLTEKTQREAVETKEPDSQREAVDDVIVDESQREAVEDSASKMIAEAMAELGGEDEALVDDVAEAVHDVAENISPKDAAEISDEDIAAAAQAVAEKMLSVDSEAEDDHKPLTTDQVVDLIADRMTDAKIVTQAQELFEETDEPAPDVEEPAPDVEVKVDDDDLAAAAYDIAEMLIASTIRAPRI